MQTTSNLLMIKPVRFDFNAETAVNNSFQQASADQQVSEKAAAEFDRFVSVLSNAGVQVTVVEDTPEPHTPDSVFPNNWISFHDDGTIFLYPMFAVNRRLAEKFRVANTIDLSAYEQQQVFLEGTGSMVLDRENKISYACLSPRTDIQVLHDWCNKAGFRPVAFTSVDSKGDPIYHTNVMMCIADQFAVICLDSIPDETEKRTVIETLKDTKKEIIEISFDQMNRFAGNMLQVQNTNGDRFLVMSSQAYNSLTAEQIKRIEHYNPILHSDITTIETNGGGSARCMMAEVFLAEK
jgi:hypothetical protein